MPNETGDLAWLQDWYRSNCDGTWEHTNGAKIDTLDNPGWRVEVDVGDSAADSHLQRQSSEYDWIVCRVTNGKFTGAGGTENLSEIIATLRSWVEHG